MGNISLFVAFGAGLVSFLSPCVLPLVPLYFASFCGPEIFEAKVNRFSLPILFRSLSFVIGFSVVFSLWGAGAGLVGSVLAANSTVIRQIAGGLLIVFGLFLLAALRVPWLNFEKHLSTPRGIGTHYLRPLLTGGVFSLAWTPCVGPVLAGILTLALGSGTAWHGAYLLAVYSLGLGMPFLAAGAAFGFVTPLLKRIYRYSAAIHIFSGILLIATGTLILTRRLAWF